MRADNENALQAVLASHWWALVLRGAPAILFGAAMLAWPDATLRVLASFVGVWFVGDGALALFLAFDYGRKALLVSDAGVGIVTGLIALLATGIEGVALLILIAISAVVRGILQVLLAVELWALQSSAWVFGALGAAAIVFAALLLSELANGALAVLPLIAGFALLLGVTYAAAGFWVERFDAASLPHGLPSRRLRKG